MLFRTIKKSQIFLYVCFVIIAGVGVFDFFGGGMKEVDDLGEVEFVGVVKEVDERVDEVKLKVEMIGEGTRLGAFVLITTGLYPEYEYGDELKIKGDLKKPKEFDGFDYPRYLAMKGIGWVCYGPEIEIVETRQGASVRDNGSRVYASILRFKEKLKEVIERGLPEPGAGVFEAMFLGDKRGVSQDLMDKFSRVGVSHVIAISGMHITIISGILMSILIGLGMRRKQAFWVATVFLSLYIIMIGAPASAVRAGIMGFMILLAMNLGRLNKSLNALLLVACVMLLINPLILVADVGFQLSFLAVLGIIYLGPIFEKLLEKVPEKFGLRGMLVMTFSAQIMTLPLIAYQFNKVSIIAPLVNILVLPILPFVLILGAVGVVGGLMWIGLGKVLFIPAWLLLTYLVEVVEGFSQISFAGVEIERVSFGVVVGIYIMIGVVVWVLRKKI